MRDRKRRKKFLLEFKLHETNLNKKCPRGLGGTFPLDDKTAFEFDLSTRGKKLPVKITIAVKKEKRKKHSQFANNDNDNNRKIENHKRVGQDLNFYSRELAVSSGTSL